MDRVLSRADKERLLELLKLPRQLWGDFGRMQQAYKQQSLLLHPDKGGSHALMQELNSLWGTFKTEVYNLRMNLGGTGFQGSPPRTAERGTEESGHSPLHDDYWSFSYGSKYFTREWNDFFRKWDPSYQSPPKTAESSEQPDLFCYEEPLLSPNPSPPTDTPAHPAGRRRNPCVAEPDDSISPDPPRTPVSRKRPRPAGATGGGGGGVHANGGSVFGHPTGGTSTPAHPPPYHSQGGSESMGGSDSSGFAEGSFRSDPRGESENESYSQSCSQSSFNATPPKKAREDPAPSDFPSSLTGYLSHAIYSNKTFPAFLVYSTKEKCKQLYDTIGKFRPEFKCLVHYEEGGMLFFLTMTKHRVSAVKNYCSKLCSVHVLMCKAVTKPMECYQVVTAAPFQLITENKPGLHQFEFTDEPEEQKAVDWIMVADFALENNLDDPLLIMGYYLDFAKEVPSCIKCSKEETRLQIHWKNHRKHAENADLFLNCKAQKTICQQAADGVLASRRLKLVECTRSQLLKERLQQSLLRLKELGTSDALLYLAGVAWYQCLLDDFPQTLFKMLKLLTENVPKRRNILFRGPVNSGKTGLAAALISLLGGKSLNINCPADKLAFELGVAQDQFVVCFEDVKGQIALNKQLQPGMGVANLDNLRDYLDGSVKVNLEKKHSNKRSQLFPPCVCTMNEYLLPQTVWARFHMVLDFTCKPHLAQALEKCEFLQRERIIQSGDTLALLLIWNFTSDVFDPDIQGLVKEVRDQFAAECSYSLFCDILCNVQEGDDPLKDICEYS
uniref:Large T antigen n=1 Tax=Mus musculus TaxID=10090 RepID=Q04187_MOUSE|nr:large T antigen [Mus musculus]